MRYLVLGLLVPACATELVVDEHESHVQSSNLLSANQLSANGVSLNGVSLNSLTANGVSLNGVSLDGVSLDGVSLDGIDKMYEIGEGPRALVEKSQGRHVFRYVVRCAMPDDVALTAWVEDETHVFRGALGLAPSWLDKPLSEEQRAWMSACMLSHVNAFGISVPISIRGDLGVLKPNHDEDTDFPFQEAAFFGDIFAAEPAMYGCLGWDAQGVYGHSSPYLAKRACIAGTERHAMSRCGFINMGSCDTVCENYNRSGSGPYSEIWEDCWSSTTKHPYVITVYLPAAIE